MLVLSPLVLLLIGQAASSAQPKPQPPPVLQVGIFSYTLDERLQGAAYETSLSRESFQYVAGCTIGGGNRPIPETATDAWRLSGTVQSITAEEAVVQLDWQRVRARGVAVSSPGASVQLTLHPGDRVPLDSVNSDGTPQCPVRIIGFEARFGPRPFTFMGGGSGQLDTPSGSVRSGSGVGVGRGATAGGGGGTVVRNEVGSTSNPEGGSATGAGARAVLMPKGLDTDALASKEFNAELWLVKTTPGRQEKSDYNLQGLLLTQVHGSAPFAFTPFTIDTPVGSVDVQLTGSLRLTAERGPAELIFTTLRIVRYATTNGASRDAVSTATGSSSTRNPMPGPDDVLSFELPPIRVPNSAATLPDQYSVRVRIR